jgi:anti-sigma factor RsiW
MEEMMEQKHDEEMTVLMSLALDEMLGEEDRQRLEQHLQGCPACRTEWEAMQAVSALLADSPMAGPPLGFAVRVERKLAEKDRKRRQTFGGLAVLTSSLSLAGLTVAVICLMVVAILAWQGVGPLSSLQEETSAVSQVATGMGLMGKGASLFLGDLLLRYGSLLVFALGFGIVVLGGLWTWLFLRRPRNRQHNGYV